MVENDSAVINLGSHYLYIEDAGHKLSLADILDSSNSSKFKPSESDNPNFGYSISAFWIKTDINNRLASPTDWFLEIPFPTLDHVDVYLVDPVSGEVMSRQTSGDMLAFSQRPYPHRNMVFPLKLPPSKLVSLIIRVESLGSLTVSSTLWPPQAFHLHSRNAYLALSLYFGTLVALFAYNFLLFLSLRDKGYLYYVLFVGAMALGQLSWNGLGNEYFWTENTAWANIASIAGFNATGMFGAIFCRTFLNTRRSAPTLDKIIMACGGVFSLLIALIPFISYQHSAMLTSVTGVVFSFVATLSGVVCLIRGFTSARYFLLAWTMLLLGTAALGARNLGWIPTNFFTLYAMQIGSALEMLLLSFALAERISDLQREKEAAQIEAYNARQGMIDALTRTEHELEDLVSARTRDLTSINEQLQESEKLLRKLAHHDPLTGLANRHLLDERLVSAIERAKRRHERIAVLLVDLDNLKPVNDNHGHDAGDIILRAVAQRLKNSVRASDTVARMGGDEFVILLEDLAGPYDAVVVSRKILDEMKEPVPVKSFSLHISVSIGVALYPDDGDEAQTLIKHADRAMYGSKLGGRNRVTLSSGIEAALKGAGV
ncbi:MAG: GGDEF domain-containing protein [Nitrospinae bacterium]|nr:GGDEF domain-containing protein [Nitrospinota bacterium]